ncbi:PTS sugar transporter subunit IIB [Fusibacter ferrireducens]|uniref:PTS sugar transporter subunit IIB n=1 Tax=Fusibacter ferrireducens TaxID=2785058 RepID=A0ABR9ZVI3_9FIRM|nr:PTS sugar transporter subunit IIB [Fusibacter ferrireducens]MBF4694457.1 PTS sugar transporter subunit IIB [Fusibacter ferrireducens]
MKNIVLFCAAGMSTSLLVKKMEKAAEQEGFECKIAAHSLNELKTYGPDADIVLLGPQVRYNLDKVKTELPEKLVVVIDMKQYGMMDGKGVLEMVHKTLGE